MRFAVCDDEKEFRDDVRNVVYAYSNLHRLGLVVEDYECGEKLLESEHDYEIIFLDYKMEGIDGLETARKLREGNINSGIIFLTSYPKFIHEAFEVSAFRFYKKPLDAKLLHEALDDYFNKRQKNRIVLLTLDRETICVKSDEIIYLEADNKKCYVNLFGKKLHLSRTMKSVEEDLPKNDFIKIHKAFIVNLEHVRSYDDDFVNFKLGGRAPISRFYRAAFKKAHWVYVKSRKM